MSKDLKDMIQQQMLAAVESYDKKLEEQLYSNYEAKPPVYNFPGLGEMIREHTMPKWNITTSSEGWWRNQKFVTGSELSVPVTYYADSTREPNEIEDEVNDVDFSS